MATATIQVFRVSKDGKSAEPCGSVEAESPTSDGIFPAARSAVAEKFGSVRSISEGPSGVVAYVEQSA